jgi:hypothetical protein
MRVPPHALGVAGSIGWTLLLSGLLVARSEAQQRTTTATLLRVLSEAADVYRTGKPIYLVADYRYPHNVLPGFGNKDSALTAAKRLNANKGASFDVFGPYVTPQDSISETALQIVSISITTKTSSGTKTHTVDPRRTDALFLNLSAIDKFVLPYYSKVLGPAYASRLREKSIEAIRSGAFMRHCWSWMCTDPPDPLHVIGPPVPPHQVPIGPPGAPTVRQDSMVPAPR